MKLQGDLAREILALSNTMIKNRNKHLEGLNLTAAQADSMQYFLTHSQATIKDLKEHLDITHQTAQGIVSRLAEKGLISIQRSLSDKRCQSIFVTQAGYALGERIAANRNRTGQLLLSGMTEAEAEQFYRLVHTAYENIKDDGEGT